MKAIDQNRWRSTMSSTVSPDPALEEYKKRARILRASITHHEPPSDTNVRPEQSSLKILRQSQSEKQPFHSTASNADGSHVSFDSVEVVEFPETVGWDAVPCTSGPPVMLSDDETGHVIEKVDEFEAHHDHRHHRVILRMSKAERERKLREEGVASSEFRVAEQEVAEVRDSRKQSARDPESMLKYGMIETKRKVREGTKRGLVSFLKNPLGGRVGGRGERSGKKQ